MSIALRYGRYRKRLLSELRFAFRTVGRKKGEELVRGRTILASNVKSERGSY